MISQFAWLGTLGLLLKHCRCELIDFEGSYEVIGLSGF